MTEPRFADVSAVAPRLAETGYLSTSTIDTVVFLADRLGKPLLVEGPAGVGKTELAKALAATFGSRLVRLQCYEGVDEAKVLYEWNYKKQLLRIQVDAGSDWDTVTDDIFSEPFLLERPVLTALRSEEPVLLLIDEVDKLDVEAEALLLEVLSDWQVTIPEMGTITAKQQPVVVLTSNNSRELSEALKRRCLYLYLDYPDVERETAILRERAPGIEEELARGAARVVASLRSLDLKKAPSIAETIDWAKTLMHLNARDLDPEIVRDTLSVLLKYETDLEKAREHLEVGGR